MRVLCLTFGNEQTASTQYRILQYQPSLAAQGIFLETQPANTFKNFEHLAHYDLIVLQKTLLPLSKLRKIRKYARKLLYDLDDLIWQSPNKQHHFLTRLKLETRLRSIAHSADLCLTANHYLNQELKKRSAHTHVLPMSLDGRLWQPQNKPEKKTCVIGWSGAPKNLPYLEAILPHLKKIQEEFPQALFQIHSGENPRWSNFNYDYLPYQPGQEPAAVAGFDLGLLPLPDNAFARGKSPIKALQYMACGVVPIASAVGATCETCLDQKNALLVYQPEQWLNHLRLLILNQDKRQDLAQAARHFFLNHHELQTVGKNLAHFWKTLT
jgi:glycosyltransferase involved in cell wall biosynthesis